MGMSRGKRRGWTLQGPAPPAENFDHALQKARTFRPSAVGQTYLDLAHVYKNIDMKGCHPSLKKHVQKAGRNCEQIAELFGAGGLSRTDIRVAITFQRTGGSFGGTAESSAAAFRIIALLSELAEADDRIIRELGLD